MTLIRYLCLVIWLLAISIFCFALALMFALSASAATIAGQQTVTTVVDTIALSDCSWTEVVEQTTTTAYREVQPVTITSGYSDPTTGTGYVGGQPGRAVSCPQDCDYSIVLGTPAFTSVESLGGGFTEWEEKVVSRIETLVDTCTEDCEHPPEEQTPVPEPSTLALLFGAVIVVAAKWRVA